MLSGRLLAAFVLAGSATTVAHAQSGVAPAACPGISHKLVQVSGRNDEWTSADIKVQPGDRVLVVASGKVDIGGFGHSEVSAKGSPSGNGKLHMKVGTGTVIPVGERWFGEINEAGSVKFRVQDANYNDNAGGFEVSLIVISPSAIPSPVTVAAE